MRTRSKWSPGPGIRVRSVVFGDEGRWVVSACGPTSGICPDCRYRSRNRHGWSYRSLQDLPIQGHAVTVAGRAPRSSVRSSRTTTRRSTQSADAHVITAALQSMSGELHDALSKTTGPLNLRAVPFADSHHSAFAVACPSRTAVRSGRNVAVSCGWRRGGAMVLGV